MKLPDQSTIAFKELYNDYPHINNITNAEFCTVNDQDIPSGSGGINGERYTYGQLSHQPIIPELAKHIKNFQIKKYAEECNYRNSIKGFKMFKVEGEYCFWGLRVGPVLKTPNVNEIKRILLENPQTAPSVNEHKITASMIRAITYDLLRKELASSCNISIEDAASAIGNQLDCAPHEDISGFIFMVPNWAHKWFRHDGYVSKILSEL